MKRLMLQRVSILPEGAFGVLLEDGVPFAVTCERTYPAKRDVLSDAAWQAAWDLGVTEYPKIPGERSYRCEPTVYFKRPHDAIDKHTYEITGVEGHSRLLFHVGNVEDDSEGCVLVGEQFGLLDGRPAVLASKAGFQELARRAGGQAFVLDVRDPL